MGNTLSLIQLPTVIKVVNELSLKIKKLEEQVQQLQENAAKQQPKAKKND